MIPARAKALAILRELYPHKLCDSLRDADWPKTSKRWTVTQWFENMTVAKIAWDRGDESMIMIPKKAWTDSMALHEDQQKVIAGQQEVNRKLLAQLDHVTATFAPKLNTIGDRVRWARKRQGLTVAQLAKETGVPAGEIRALERDTRRRLCSPAALKKYQAAKRERRAQP